MSWTDHPRLSWLKLVFSPRMLVAFVMGFSCGLPLLLTGSVLQAWLKKTGVDLGTIGLFNLVGLPYAFKFLWAPAMDRFTLRLLGRRRGWLLIAQLALIGSLVLLAFSRPAISPWWLAFMALLVTFFSASQDIVVDAYRREDLTDRQLGLGSSLYVNGYRVGMLLAGGGGLIIADQIGFRGTYLVMALSMLVGVVTTLVAREPEAPHGVPQSWREAVISPFIEYFSRPSALWILGFILLYKLGDILATSITTPFYLDLGYSMTEIGAVVKLFGFWATIIGGLIGGVIMVRVGIYRSLWGFGVLQAISTTGFAVLAVWGFSLPMLTLVIAFENLSGGMGTAAYVAFMASQTDKRFTATQYALLSSVMGIPRVIVTAPSGYLAEWLGWFGFFIGCALIAIPGLLILLRFRKLVD